MPSNEQPPKNERPDLAVAASWAFALLTEGVAAVMLWRFFLAPAGTWVAGAALVHLLAATGLFVAGGHGAAGRSGPRSRLRLFGVLTLFLPGMGIVGSLFLQLACDRWIRARGLVADFQTETAHQVIELPRPEDQMDLTAFFDAELSVQPVMDILAGHDENLKRGAIDTLRRIGTREAVNVLKKCLTDDNPEVRYHAHSALTRLEESHTRRIGSAQKALDASTDQPAAHAAYAARCAAYGDSGLLDRDSQHHYVEMARGAYLAAHRLGADDADLLMELGRLEMIIGCNDDAADRFREVLSRDPGNPQALLGLAEACFNTSDVSGLHAVTQKMQSARIGTGLPVQEEILIKFWSAPQSEA